jgi:DNA invertase Pin-like site-specific DNA recombinase
MPAAAYENRRDVDWDARYRELLTILERYRHRDGSNWDCIVPVSGGKDSTYQVVRMLQLGLAEFERSLIAERTGEGRERARREGRRLGRPPKLTSHQKALIGTWWTRCFRAVHRQWRRPAFSTSRS